MEKYVISDLDGTLCDHDHRLYLAWLGRWDDYNSGCIHDKIINSTLDFLRCLVRSGYKIIRAWYQKSNTL